MARSGGTWALPGEPCRDTRVVLGAREAVHVEAGEGYAASARARDAVLEASVGRVAPANESGRGTGGAWGRRGSPAGGQTEL